MRQWTHVESMERFRPPALGPLPDSYSDERQMRPMAKGYTDVHAHPIYEPGVIYERERPPTVGPYVEHFGNTHGYAPYGGRNMGINNVWYRDTGGASWGG